MSASRPAPGIARRLFCLVYESLLLTAVILLAGGIATGIAHALGIEHPRWLTQACLLLTCAAYFMVQWLRSGQTLPMKTWRMRLETVEGRPLNAMSALRRLLLAAIGYGAAGITVLWALIDRDRQFLHDRLGGTRLVSTAEP